jgi:hypothetical protein
MVGHATRIVLAVQPRHFYDVPVKLPSTASGHSLFPGNSARTDHLTVFVDVKVCAWRKPRDDQMGGKAVQCLLRDGWHQSIRAFPSGRRALPREGASQTRLSTTGGSALDRISAFRRGADIEIFAAPASSACHSSRVEEQNTATYQTPGDQRQTLLQISRHG